jgi:GMP synthase (glutamine-hydrolysing)
MGARLLVVRHEAGDPPGQLGDAAADMGIELEVVAADLGEKVPERLKDATGLAVLGGLMGVGDVAEYPHLETTMELIRDAAARGAPTLGICLGAQLAAHALGGRVDKAPEGLEYGWIELRLTPRGRADEVVGALDQDARVFAAHYDVFDPPPGSTMLALGAQRPNQAFRLGSVVGVQFHPEVDAAMVAEWYDNAPGPLPCSRREAVDGAVRHAPASRRMLDAFCRVVARAAGG